MTIIIILGFILNHGKLDTILKERLNLAIELYTKYNISDIYVSGSDTAKCGVNESFVMKDYLIKNGIDCLKIIEENRSNNTFENALYVKQLIPIDVKNIIVVTSDFHVHRAKLIFEKFFRCNLYFHGSKTFSDKLQSLLEHESKSIAKFY